MMMSKIFGFLSGACFLAMLFWGCCVDSPNWLLALGLFAASAVGCYLFYVAATWAADRED